MDSRWRVDGKGFVGHMHLLPLNCDTNITSQSLRQSYLL